MDSKQKKIFFVVGEASGDLHASKLIEAILLRDSKCHFLGVAGPKMRQAGVECVMPMEQFQIMGFYEVLLSLPRLYQQGKSIVADIKKSNPAAVIFIDYPGLNLRLARLLRKDGYTGKLIYYICPKVWAWQRKRIEQMSSNLDLLLVILPFETECFKHTSLAVHYVGQPLLDIIQKHTYCKEWRQKVGLQSALPLLSLFPGSRHAEIEHNLPLQLKALEQFIQQNASYAIAISVTDAPIKNTIETILSKYPELRTSITLVPREYTYECMKESCLAIAKSGTVTLELALHCVPTIVVYELSYFNWFVAKYILRINLPYYSLANIVAQKSIFPEIIGANISHKKLLDAMRKWSNNADLRKQCQEQCQTLYNHLLQPQSASQCAARHIVQCLSS